MNILNNEVNGLQETVAQRRQERESWTEGGLRNDPSRSDQQATKKSRRIYKINNVVKTTEN